MRTHTKKSTDVIRNIPQDTYLYVKFTKAKHSSGNVYIRY